LLLESTPPWHGTQGHSSLSAEFEHLRWFELPQTCVS